MKKLQANFVLLTVLILLPIIFFGQTRVLQTPEKYLMPTENVEHPKPDDVLSSRPWFVFSDRSDNPVYATSESIATNSVLDFGEACVALEVKNNRLLLARPEDIRRGLVLPGKTPIGWVDFEKLLLWNNCLKTETCKLDKKAMVLNVFNSDNSIVIGQTPKFYSGAGASFDTLGDAGTGIAQKYFVYKEAADYFLLGSSSSIQKLDFWDVVSGWIPKKYCTIWNTNLALEINWYPDAVGEREQMGNSVLVWENKIGAENFNKDAKLVFFESPMYLKRTNGFLNHFLLLEQNNNSKVNATNEPINVGMLGDEESQLWEKFLKIRMKSDYLQKINIIFVVDASNSIESYSASIINALKNAALLIKDKNSRYSDYQNEIRFGAVLFRDETEQQIVHRFGSSLSSNINELGQWIKTYNVPQYNRNDKDIPEALFYGIYQAMEWYNPDSKETNYIIIIGDAGDHQNPDKKITYISEEFITNELANLNMNMLVYQINHPKYLTIENPYLDFENQLKRIMINSAVKVQKKMYRPDAGVIQFEESEHNTFKLNNYSPLVDQIIISPPQTTMNAQQLENNLASAIQRIDSLTTLQIQKIEGVFEGKPCECDWQLRVRIATFLKENGFNDDEIMVLLFNNNKQLKINQSYHECYTIMHPSNANFPWFQYVLLVEDNDLNALRRKLQDLFANRSYSMSIKRHQLIQAWEEIFRISYGNQSNTEIQQIPIGNWFQCFTGLPFTWKYSNLTLSDVGNPVIVTDKDIDELIRAFARTHEYVEAILHHGHFDYPHINFGNSNQVYYWVPVEIFPHD